MVVAPGVGCGNPLLTIYRTIIVWLQINQNMAEIEN